MAVRLVDCLEMRMDRRKEEQLFEWRVEMKGETKASQLVVMMVSWLDKMKEMRKVGYSDWKMVA